MESLITDNKTITLLLATLFTGLLAGVFFTWSNAITPGIGRLYTLSYLRAFQEMNRTILNPLFFLVIFGAMFFSFATAYFHKSNTVLFWLFLSAAVIYFIGVFLLTIMGNVPLNEMLNKTDLLTISLEDANVLREKFEAKWNTLHLIRTIVAVISFLLLIIGCLLKNKV
ncbi:DUF1772 domain-containing protein [Flavobacterium cupreum]|uniref:DUF1772 domain-containing protein n=1 Tax=Flavobacterium cupreum TaxID=2133766 RepID=A0A434A6I0_9FLAO|nr:DUF1772 domain-containing protein [Flavobacterium cupreum]RUT69945.1 DUF1772 domain-containing protein [Flavobacterium cupreum]